MAKIVGTKGKDKLFGTPFSDLMLGLGFGDQLFGYGGADTLRGGDGADRLDGGSGHDALYGNAGNDKILGGTGNDTAGGDLGNDTIWGGAGHDKVRGGEGRDNLAGQAGNDSLYGGTGNDTLNGGEGHDSLAGDGGDDLLSGGAGRDTLAGGAGLDTLLGGEGDDLFLLLGDLDVIAGGAGNDMISYAAYNGATLALALEADNSVSTGLRETVTGVEGIIGSAQQDFITLRASGWAIGGGGSDQLSSGFVFGGGSITTNLRGDDGNDVLQGGRDLGSNLINNDRFWIQLGRGFDTIQFFAHGQDQIVVSAAAFNVVGQPGLTLPVEYFGSSSDPFAATNNERLIFETDTHMLWADLDGRGSKYASELVAILPQSLTLTAGDFIVAA